MPRQKLTDDEGLRLLARRRLVRVGFQDKDAPYLIPLGYVFLHSALYGVTEPGRKTRAAEFNPRVAFQVDTSSDSGLWEWDSVTGEGSFELVSSDAEREQALSALQPLLEAAPDWWRREQAARITSGALVVWKIVPTSISGCRYAPSWSIGRPTKD